MKLFFFVNDTKLKVTKAKIAFRREIEKYCETVLNLIKRGPGKIAVLNVATLALLRAQLMSIPYGIFHLLSKDSQSTYTNNVI